MCRRKNLELQNVFERIVSLTFASDLLQIPAEDSDDPVVAPRNNLPLTSQNLPNRPRKLHNLLNLWGGLGSVAL